VTNLDNQAGRASDKLYVLLLNQDWFRDELRSLGHETLFVGWEEDSPDVVIPKTGCTLHQLLDKIPADFPLNRIVYYDNSGPIAIIGLEHSEVPTLFYSVDSHHHVEWHRYFSAVFDATIVAQRDYVPPFIDTGAPASWFPLWAPLTVTPVAEKSCDVSFRGNLDPKYHPERAVFFERLKELVPVDTGMGGYIDIFSRSKIVINQTVKNDVNFRVFESMMCGALLLTPSTGNGIDQLFQDGVEFCLYEHNNAQDAADKIRYFLEHEQERATIAQNGRQAVLDKHSALARAKQLAQMLQGLKISARSNRYLGAGVAYLTSATLCKKALPEIANQLVKYAAECFRAVEPRGSECQQELCNSVFVTKFLLEKEGYLERASELLSSFYQLYPKDPLIALAYLHSLVIRQQETLASDMAQRISEQPAELLSSIHPIMDSLKSSLFLQLGDNWP